MQITRFPQAVTAVALLCPITLLMPSAHAQTTPVPSLLIEGNSTPPASLPGNQSGLLFGSSTTWGFRWIESYGGSLLINPKDRGLQSVGIGLTRPNWTLDVAGTIQGDSSVSAYNFVAPGVIGKSANDDGVRGISGNGAGLRGTGAFGVYAKGLSVGVLTEGFVGIAAIGTGPNHLAGNFNGNVIVVGNLQYSGALTHASDLRYKTAVRPLGSALETVEKLRGVTYNYNRTAFPQMNFPATRQVGFVAQEVRSVLPQLVHKDQNGYLSIDYVQVVPVLVEAIKEQQKQIDALKAQNQRITTLEARLAALTPRTHEPQKIAKK